MHFHIHALKEAGIKDRSHHRLLACSESVYVFRHEHVYTSTNTTHMQLCSQSVFLASTLDTVVVVTAV